MSEENVEIVRRVYEAVSANLWDAPSELFDPEYEVDLTDAGPDLGVISGVEASEAALRGYTERSRTSGSNLSRSSMPTSGTS